MSLFEAQWVDLILDFADEARGIIGWLRSSDGVTMMEAMSKRNKSSQGDECLDLFVGACKKEIRIHQYDWFVIMNDLSQHSHP